MLEHVEELYQVTFEEEKWVEECKEHNNIINEQTSTHYKVENTTRGYLSMMFLVKLHFIDCVFTHSADSQRTNRNERFETQLFPLEWEFTEEGIEPLQVVNVYKSSEIKSRSGSKSDPKSEKEISDKKKGIPEPFISLE